MYPPEQILPPHNLPLFSSNTSEPSFHSSSRFEELYQLASPSFYLPNSPYSSLQYNEDHLFNELIWEQLQQPFPSLTEQSAMQSPCQAPNLKQDAALPMPQNNVEKKRPTKKDRHSKITTAKGLRDRRVRLSLDVGRKFFYLQDVLGYDKASKTVEWLFIQANSAIDELLQGYTALATTAASVSSTQSECEVVSGIEDASATTATAAVKGSKKPEKKAKVVSAKRSRESRKEAREKARTRTLARKTGADLKQCLEGGRWGGQLCGSVEESLGLKDVDDQRRNYGGGDDISVITRNWNPCCIFQQQDAAPQISHVNNELPEFEYCGKAWDYNNI